MCTWLEGRKSLKDQRRGFGPVKSRADFQPKEIQPAKPSTAGGEAVIESAPLVCDLGNGAPLPLTSASQVQDTFGFPQRPCLPPDESAMITNTSIGHLFFDPSSAGGIVQRNPTVGTDEWWSEWNAEDGGLHFPSPSNGSASDAYSQVFEPTFDLENFEQILLSSGTDAKDLQSMPGMSFSPLASLSDYHLALPNSLTLTLPEHEALRHYQTTYSLYRTTKDPNWSTHKVLLSIGAQNPMIMHFLLAVSLNDYSLRKGQASSASSDAETHFQEGARLLIEEMKVGTEQNHVTTMAAYFFIYLYMSKRKSTAPQRLTQLSLTVMEYVERNELNIRCIGPSEFPDDSTALIPSSSGDNSLLARLIMWTFDEDVKCSFQSTGGHLARHLTKNTSRTRDVYEASRNTLADYWKVDYPNSQQLDDDLNSTVLEFLWAMMPLWQDINDLPHEQELMPMDLLLRIEHNFSFLEQVRVLPLILPSYSSICPSSSGLLQRVISTIYMYVLRWQHLYDPFIRMSKLKCIEAIQTVVIAVEQ